jgi:cytochrome P450
LTAGLRALIEDKRANAGEDILSLLLAVRDEDGDALSEQEILEQLLSFIVAGHETTATSLAWATYLVHRNPPVRDRLRADLRALGDAPSPEAVARLPYLEAVCQETLRLYPPVPMVPRKLTRDFELKGFTIPAGMSMAAGVYMAHLRPETFPDPLEFRPERFLGRSYTPFEYMPFGGGSRRCLGAAFAMYEMKVVLAELLSHPDLQLEEPKPVRNVFRIATYGPETGVRMKLAG